jgi:hypothetical protein
LALVHSRRWTFLAALVFFKFIAPLNQGRSFTISLRSKLQEQELTMIDVITAQPPRAPVVRSHSAK